MGWAGTGTVQRRGGENRGGGKKDTFTIFVASSSLSLTSSFSLPKCERLTTCATSPLAPSSQTRPVQHSGQKTESLVTFSLKLMFYQFEVLFDWFVDLFHRSDQLSQEWQQPCMSSRYAFLLAQRTYKASQNVDFTKPALFLLVC